MCFSYNENKNMISFLLAVKRIFFTRPKRVLTCQQIVHYFRTQIIKHAKSLYELNYFKKTNQVLCILFKLLQSNILYEQNKNSQEVYFLRKFYKLSIK